MKIIINTINIYNVHGNIFSGNGQHFSNQGREFEDADTYNIVPKMEVISEDHPMIASLEKRIAISESEKAQIIEQLNKMLTNSTQ